MVHTATRSPLSTAMVAIAAGAVMLATTTIEPPRPPAALTASTVSTQAVHLTALAGPLQIARSASASSDLASVGDVLPSIPAVITQGLKSVILAPVAGAAAGVFFGFIGGGILAGNLLRWVPEPLVVLVTPVVQAGAVLGAIVGIPIGAVVGPILAIRSLVSSVRPQSDGTTTAAARAPGASGRTAASTAQRTTRQAVRPHRSLATPSATQASEHTVAQQHSKPARRGTSPARDAASKAAARS